MFAVNGSRCLVVMFHGLNDSAACCSEAADKVECTFISLARNVKTCRTAVRKPRVFLDSAGQLTFKR